MRLGRLFMRMRSVFVRVFDLIQFGVVHFVVELLLRQSFFFGFLCFTPEFMISLVTQVILSVNGFMCMYVKKLTFFILFRTSFNFCPC